MPFGRRRRPSDKGPRDAPGESLQNAALVEAMRAVSVSDTEENRALLFRRLRDSTLVVAPPEAPPTTGMRRAGEGDHLRLVTLEDEEGSMLPVFTSVDTLLEWRASGGGYAALPARSLFEMAASTSTSKLLINPGSATGGIVTRQDLDALARGRLPLGSTEVIAEETQVRIGRPAHPPSAEVLQAVRQALAAEQRCVAGWLFLMQRGATDPELMVGVELAPGVVGESERAAMRAIAEGAGQRSNGARSLAFIPASRGLKGSLAANGDEIFRR